MAYVSKEMKVALVAEIKKVLPKTWKATYAINNMSTLVVTIRKAPIDLVEAFETDRTEFQVSEYHYKNNCKDEEVKSIIEKLFAAMNGQNYDNSDRMTDYFDVGYYTELRFGDWKKDFESTK
ncbi:MAG: hypothetical protein [Caudoviricetes sp.]|nr:MAG: hypothetical protein [Caudoviricetes sp.]